MKKHIILLAVFALSLAASAAQCAAITKKGERCKRNSASGSVYCWQHKK